MKKEKIYRIMILLIVSLMVISFPNFTDNSKAIQVGEFLVCNFDDRTNGETSWIEYVSGDPWLTIDGNPGLAGVAGGTDKYYGFLSNNGKIVYFNLTDRFTSYFNFSVHAGTWSATVYQIDYAFLRSNGDQVLRLRHMDGGQSGCYNEWKVMDSDNTVLKDVSYGGCTSYSQYDDNVQVTFNYTEQEVNVYIDNHSINYWWTPGVFDYCPTLKIWQSYYYGPGGYPSYSFDDLRILGDDSELPQLWEIDAESRGCVACDYEDYLNLDFSETDTIVVESDCKFYGLGTITNQVALSVHSDTDLDDITTWLRIGDEYQAQRETYYTYNDLYVITWIDINVSVFEDALPLEFKFICTDTSKKLRVVYINDDVDSDSDRFFKYSLNGDHWNGIYDGEIYKNRDLCYKIWYGGTAAFGDLNVSVFNESIPSEALENWSIQIVNYASGVIEYNDTNCTNPTVIDAGEYGLGKRLIYISCVGFYDRVFYVDVENYVNYTLNAYLPYIDVSELYVIQVLDNSTGSPIKNVEIHLTKFFGANIKEIASGFTNAYGMFYVYLIPNTNYYVNLSKSGYESLTAEQITPDPNKYGIEYPIIFRLVPEEDNDTEIPDIYLDILVLWAYNSTHMGIYYNNPNNDNEYVEITVYDFFDNNNLLQSYNETASPNNTTKYFNWSAYDLEGDILKVISDGYRANGSVHRTIRFFNIHQKPPGGDPGSAPIAAIISLGICLFGFTIAHPKKVFGVIGMIICTIAIAITAFANQTWYIHLVQAVEIICMLFIILTFREEGVHAV